MSGLAEKNVRTSRKISGLALFKSASPMDYQSIKSAVHPVYIYIYIYIHIVYIYALQQLLSTQVIHSLLRPLSTVGCKLCQSSLLDHRPMFVSVSLFLVCLAIFLLLLSAQHRKTQMCLSLCRPHKTSIFQFVYRSFSFTQMFCICGTRSPTNSQHVSVAPHFKSDDFVV